VPELAGFRVASWDAPLRVNPNRQAGRWNYADSGVTQYVGLHPLAPWAEYLRWHDIRDAAYARELRLGVWAIRLIVDDVLEVNYEAAPSLGLRPEDLVSDDWSACQAVGERLRANRSGSKILRTPSAALPGAHNIVILEPRVSIPYSFNPIDAADVPVSLAAAGARPPSSLLELVRYRGEPHPQLAAWLRGEAYELIEPSDALLADASDMD
jgi:RES domain-containing protein